MKPINDLRRLRTTLATFVFLLLAGGVFALSSAWDVLQGTGSLAMVGALATVYVGLLNYWLSRDKVMQELFTVFNKRYDDLNDNLLAISQGLPLTGSKNAEQVVVDYLNLCAEEYFWYMRGRIDKDIWKAWRVGMVHWMKFPPIQAIAKKETSSKDSYYGLFNVLALDGAEGV